MCMVGRGGGEGKELRVWGDAYVQKCARGVCVTSVRVCHCVHACVRACVRLCVRAQLSLISYRSSVPAPLQICNLPARAQDQDAMLISGYLLGCI